MGDGKQSVPSREQLSPARSLSPIGHEYNTLNKDVDMAMQRAAVAPELMSPEDLPVLQQAVGNRAMKRMLEINEVQESGTVKPKENRTGLPDRLKAGLENLSGFSLDEVRVRYQSAKPAGIRALAYTQGTEIHLGPGQDRHLPHEAWHVVQQMQGRVTPTIYRKGFRINDDELMEREADVMGRKAADDGFTKADGPRQPAICPNTFANLPLVNTTIQRKIFYRGKNIWDYYSEYDSLQELYAEIYTQSRTIRGEFLQYILFSLKIADRYKNLLPAIIKKILSTDDAVIKYSGALETDSAETIKTFIIAEIRKEIEKTRPAMAIINSDPDQTITPKVARVSGTTGVVSGTRVKREVPVGKLRKTYSFNEGTVRNVSFYVNASKPFLSVTDDNATWAWATYITNDGETHRIGGNSSGDIRDNHAEQWLITLFQKEITENNHNLQAQIEKGEVLFILYITKTPCPGICLPAIRTLLDKYPGLKIQFIFDHLYDKEEPEEYKRQLAEFFDIYGDRIRWLPANRRDLSTQSSDIWEGMQDEMYGNIPSSKQPKRRRLNEGHLAVLDKIIGKYRGSADELVTKAGEPEIPGAASVTTTTTSSAEEPVLEKTWLELFFKSAIEWAATFLEADAVNYNANNCLIHAVGRAAGQASIAVEKIIAIRDLIKAIAGEEFRPGRMLFASRRVLEIIRQELGINNEITVFYHDGSSETFFKGEGPPIVIYHDGVNHFSDKPF